MTTSTNLLELGLVAVCVGMFGCERQVSFADDVQPILIDACVSCHDSEAEGEAISGLSLTDYDDLLQGTEYGQVVVPGSAMSSALFLTVAGKTSPEIRMPPHHDESFATGRGGQLGAAQIETIRLWINQGAKNN